MNGKGIIFLQKLLKTQIFERERETETERQRETQRERETETERQRDRDRQRQSDRQSDRCNAGLRGNIDRSTEIYQRRSPNETIDRHE